MNFTNYPLVVRPWRGRHKPLSPNQQEWLRDICETFGRRPVT